MFEVECFISLFPASRMVGVQTAFLYSILSLFLSLQDGSVSAGVCNSGKSCGSPVYITDSHH